GDLGPTADDGGVGGVGEPAGGPEVVGVAVGDQHLGDLIEGAPVGGKGGLEQLGAVGPHHAGVDDGDGVVEQDVAVDRSHRERGGEGDVHDAVGQVVDDRRQRGAAHRFTRRVLPAAAIPDQNTGNSRSVVASTSSVPVLTR